MADNFEDFDEFDDFDFDDNGGMGDEPASGRNATSSIVTDGLSGFTEEFTDDKIGSITDVSKVVGRTLGGQAGADLEEGLSVGIDELREVSEDLRKKTKPFLKAIERKIPKGGMLEKIHTKLTDLTGMEETMSSEDKEGAEHDRIKAEINTLLGEKDTAERKEEKIQNAFRSTIAKTTLDAGNKAAGFAKLNYDFNSTITSDYYRRSLELKYKILYTNKTHLELAKTTNETLLKQLEGIVRNTALPDFVKMRSSEALKQIARQKVAEKVGGKLFGSEGMGTRIGKNLTSKLKVTSNTIGAALAGVTGAVDQSNEMAEMGSSTGALAGGILGGMGKDLIGKKLVGLIKKTGMGRDTIEKFNEILDDPELALQDNISAGGIKGKLSGLLKPFLNKTESDKRVVLDKVNLDENAMFDNRTKQSINFVIPSYLAKIEAGIRSIRSGKDEETLDFSRDKGKLQSGSKQKTEFKNNMRRDAALSGVPLSIQSMLDTILKGTEITLSPNQRKDLMDRLYDFAISDKPLTALALVKNGFYEKLGEIPSKAFKEGLDKYLRPEGELDVERKDNFNSKFKGIRSAMNDPTVMINKEINDGNGELLEDIGLVTWNNKTNQYDVNLKKYHSMQKSMNVSSNISEDAIAIRKENTPEINEELLKTINETATDVKEAVVEKTSGVKKNISKFVKDKIGTRKEIEDYLDSKFPYSKTIDNVRDIKNNVFEYVKDLDGKTAKEMIDVVANDVNKYSKEQIEKLEKTKYGKPLVANAKRTNRIAAIKAKKAGRLLKKKTKLIAERRDKIWKNISDPTLRQELLDKGKNLNKKDFEEFYKYALKETKQAVKYDDSASLGDNVANKFGRNKRMGSLAKKLVDNTGKAANQTVEMFTAKKDLIGKYVPDATLAKNLYKDLKNLEVKDVEKFLKDNKDSLSDNVEAVGASAKGFFNYDKENSLEDNILNGVNSVKNKGIDVKKKLSEVDVKDKISGLKTNLSNLTKSKVTPKGIGRTQEQPTSLNGFKFSDKEDGKTGVFSTIVDKLDTTLNLKKTSEDKKEKRAVFLNTTLEKLNKYLKPKKKERKNSSANRLKGFSSNIDGKKVSFGAQAAGTKEEEGNSLLMMGLGLLTTGVLGGFKSIMSTVAGFFTGGLTKVLGLLGLGKAGSMLAGAAGSLLGGDKDKKKKLKAKTKAKTKIKASKITKLLGGFKQYGSKALKFVPGIATLLRLGGVASDLASGDFAEAGVGILSSLVSVIPVVGPMAAIMMDFNKENIANLLTVEDNIKNKLDQSDEALDKKLAKVTTDISDDATLSKKGYTGIADIDEKYNAKEKKVLESVGEQDKLGVEIKKLAFANADLRKEQAIATKAGDTAKAKDIGEEIKNNFSKMVDHGQTLNKVKTGIKTEKTELASIGLDKRRAEVVVKQNIEQAKKDPVRIPDSSFKDSGVLNGSSREIALVIRTMETKNQYSKVGVLKDGAGISFGAYQLTQKAGSLSKFLKLYSSMSHEYTSEAVKMNKVVSTKGTKIPRAEVITWLRKIGNTPSAMKAQDLIFYKHYYTPALKATKGKFKNKYVIAHLIDQNVTGGMKWVARNIKGDDEQSVITARIAYYSTVPSQEKRSRYLKGWKNRVAHFSKMLHSILSGGVILEEETPNFNLETDPTATAESIGKGESTDSEGGIMGGVKAAIKDLLTSLGMKPVTESSGGDSLTATGGASYTGSTPSALQIGDDGLGPELPAAHKKPVINDWKTELRYKSLGLEAKSFYVGFSNHMKAKGVFLMIPGYGGNRTIADQKGLYAKGRTAPGNVVTWTETNSKHIGGKAVDIISAKGFSANKENNLIATEMREFARQHPEYGASFLKISKDPNHVQFNNAKPIASFSAEARIKAGRNKTAMKTSNLEIGKTDSTTKSMMSEAKRPAKVVESSGVDLKVAELTKGAPSKTEGSNIPTKIPGLNSKTFGATTTMFGNDMSPTGILDKVLGEDKLKGFTSGISEVTNKFSQLDLQKSMDTIVKPVSNIMGGVSDVFQGDSNGTNMLTDLLPKLDNTAVTATISKGNNLSETMVQQNAQMIELLSAVLENNKLVPPGTVDKMKNMSIIKPDESRSDLKRKSFTG